MKFAIWDEDGTDIIFLFDDTGEFIDISEEGKAHLDSIGISDYSKWLGGIEYPTIWGEYDQRSEKKEELLNWITV